MKETIQDFICLSVTDCKRLGFFKPDAYTSGTIRWNRNGKAFASIGFATDLTCVPFAALSYVCNGKSVEQRIYLRLYKSNLPGNGGKYCYFVCPVTGRKCRKLYLSEGRFVSRFALGVPYEKQLQSKSRRHGLFAYLDALNDYEDHAAQPHRRTYYKGRLTPYGRKLEKLERKFERVADNLKAPFQYSR